MFCWNPWNSWLRTCAKLVLSFISDQTRLDFCTQNFDPQRIRVSCHNWSTWLLHKERFQVISSIIFRTLVGIVVCFCLLKCQILNLEPRSKFPAQTIVSSISHILPLLSSSVPPKNDPRNAQGSCLQYICILTQCQQAPGTSSRARVTHTFHTLAQWAKIMKFSARRETRKHAECGAEGAKNGTTRRGIWVGVGWPKCIHACICKLCARTKTKDGWGKGNYGNCMEQLGTITISCFLENEWQRLSVTTKKPCCMFITIKFLFPNTWHVSFPFQLPAF